MMRPMNTPGLNGFPQAGMQMGNNSGMNMQMGGQPLGGPQMSPQTIPMQQVSSCKCHAKYIIIFLGRWRDITKSNIIDNLCRINRRALYLL
jgi:hypothetical protein